MNHAVEIIGKVQNDLSVKVMASTDFGPENGIGKLSMMECMMQAHAV
jgi:replication factor A3